MSVSFRHVRSCSCGWVSVQANVGNSTCKLIYSQISINVIDFKCNFEVEISYKFMSKNIDNSYIYILNNCGVRAKS